MDLFQPIDLTAETICTGSFNHEHLDILQSLGLITGRGVKPIVVSGVIVGIIANTGNILALGYGNSSFRIPNIPVFHLKPIESVFSDPTISYSVLLPIQKSVNSEVSQTYYINCVKILAKILPKIEYPSDVDPLYAKAFIYDLEYVVENQQCKTIELE